jgi:membrane associated rhomboid family serine protease
MRRTASIMNFPDFRGFTRKLILWNLGIYFALLLLSAVVPPLHQAILNFAVLVPDQVLRGKVWQLVTYSFIHFGILGPALELLSIWFLGSFLESMYGPRWLAQIYFTSVIGAGLAAVLLVLTPMPGTAWLFGSYGGTFGMMIAFAVLHGDMEFMLFPLPMQIKAKYLAAVYLLIATASFFLENKFIAISQLGGALAGYLYIRYTGRRPAAFGLGEWYFRLKNNYYRWKRRRAARKFEVYMRKQNRDVHFDSEGRYIDPDKRSKPN